MKFSLNLKSDDFQTMMDYINNNSLVNQVKLNQFLLIQFGERVSNRPLEAIALLPYFNSVKNSQHWKNPINAFCRVEDKKMIAEAISYFTGTDAKFESIENGGDWLHVQADGYYLGPCN